MRLVAFDEMLPEKSGLRHSYTAYDRWLKQQDPAILPALTVFNTQILPMKAFEAAAGATDEEKAKSYSEHPISSGPSCWNRGSAARP